MIYRFRDSHLDEARRELWRAGRLVAVEPKVFQSCSPLEHRGRREQGGIAGAVLA